MFVDIQIKQYLSKTKITGGIHVLNRIFDSGFVLEGFFSSAEYSSNSLHFAN